MKWLVCVCFALVLISQEACADEALKIDERVWTTDVLLVREAPGTISSQTDSMIKGTVGTVIEGPIYEEGYNWWKIKYDTGTVGWSAENWLQKAPAEPQHSDSFAAWGEEAINWSNSRLGQAKWYGL